MESAHGLGLGTVALLLVLESFFCVRGLRKVLTRQLRQACAQYEPIYDSQKLYQGPSEQGSSPNHGVCPRMKPVVVQPSGKNIKR